VHLDLSREADLVDTLEIVHAHLNIRRETLCDSCVRPQGPGVFTPPMYRLSGHECRVRVVRVPHTVCTTTSVARATVPAGDNRQGVCVARQKVAGCTTRVPAAPAPHPTLPRPCTASERVRLSLAVCPNPLTLLSVRASATCSTAPLLQSWRTLSAMTSDTLGCPSRARTPFRLPLPRYCLDVALRASCAQGHT